jgi:hypothetical protein
MENDRVFYGGQSEWDLFLLIHPTVALGASVPHVRTVVTLHESVSAESLPALANHVALFVAVFVVQFLLAVTEGGEKKKVKVGKLYDDDVASISTTLRRRRRRRCCWW